MNGEITIETEDGEQYVGNIKDMEVSVEREFPQSEGEHSVDVAVGSLWQTEPDRTIEELIWDIENETGPLGNNMKLLIKNLVRELDKRYQ